MTKRSVRTAKTRRARARARSTAIAVLALALSALVLAEPLTSFASRLWSSISGGPYAAYLEQAEKEHLKAVNARMLSELTALRSYASRLGSSRDLSIEKKVSELESLIESATALGIFKEKNSSRNNGFAKNGKSPSSGSKLAAILNSPQLAGVGRNSRADSDGEGIGGAEDLCDYDHCQHDGGDDSHSTAESTKLEKKDISASEQMMKRLNRFISVLKFIPIGTPVDGAVTSGYGHRHSPFSRGSSFHYGVDVSLPIGSKVMATGAGRVIKVTRHHTYGNLIDVQHAPGLVTRYAHLSRVAVNVGQDVKRGDVIAYSGNTGRSTGPHLHYEVIHNGKARNPAPFVQLAGKLSDFTEIG
jgi:murein DD-endopeptidase MepM/ murein hydrolase activator NlpD